MIIIFYCHYFYCFIILFFSHINIMIIIILILIIVVIDGDCSDRSMDRSDKLAWMNPPSL